MMPKRKQRAPGRDQLKRSAETGGLFDVEHVAVRAAEIVLARLSGGLTAEPAAFSTHRDGPRPREYAGRPRAWRELAPRIPGAVRLGRWVTVPREAYERWLAAQVAPAEPEPPPAREAPAPRQEAAWSPADVARDLGLRLQNGRKS
jgi:hypothetical protein